MINQNTSHDLFFEPTKVSDFPSVLESVQKYISQNYASLLLEKDKDEVKTQIMFQIQKYLSDNRLRVDGMDENGLADKLYTEMAEYSFLTKYIFGNYSEGEDAIVMMGTERYPHNEQDFNGLHIPIIYGDFFFVEALYKLMGNEFLIW